MLRWKRILGNEENRGKVEREKGRGKKIRDEAIDLRMNGNTEKKKSIIL